MSTRRVTRLQHHLWTDHGLSEGEIDFDASEAQHEALHVTPQETWPDNARRHDHEETS